MEPTKKSRMNFELRSFLFFFFLFIFNEFDLWKMWHTVLHWNIPRIIVSVGAAHVCLESHVHQLKETFLVSFYRQHSTTVVFRSSYRHLLPRVDCWNKHSIHSRQTACYSSFHPYRHCATRLPRYKATVISGTHSITEKNGIIRTKRPQKNKTKN